MWEDLVPCRRKSWLNTNLMFLVGFIRMFSWLYSRGKRGGMCINDCNGGIYGKRVKEIVFK